MKHHEGQDRSPSSPELLSPAGSPEAGYAALHYGADAVYAGLKRFSARADADNFSLGELDELVGYAHSLQPRRRVYVAMGTLVLGDEFASLVEVLGSLADIGVDAVIVRDWGVCRAAQRHFPALRLHASARMGVHNRAGVGTLARMGFARVAVAAELTLDELRGITAAGGTEVETPVHGELCYSYGGLCLFSSHALGRSANRGLCARPCRDAFYEAATCEAAKEMREGDGPGGGPFSMKDLALPDQVCDLRAAGVAALRIEGLTRGPLYVAAVMDFYRRIIDGTLAPAERPALEADLKTISGRPWTELYIEGRENGDVADGLTTGHRGAPVGAVESIVLNVGEDVPYLRFRTSRRVELHDGLQIDLPGLYKPFGFAVEKLRVVQKTRRAERKPAHEAAAGSLVEVALPVEHPQIPPGATVCCTASQEVRQRYRHARPKPGEFRSRVPLDARLEVAADEIAAHATASSPATGERIEAAVSLSGPFEKSRTPGKTEAAARAAFAKLGRTRFEPGRLDVEDPGGLFVPISALTELRRRVASTLEGALASRLAGRVELAREELARTGEADPSATSGFRWSVKAARPDLFARFEAADLEELEEVVVGIELAPKQAFTEGLASLASSVGRERVRLALPVITRGWEEGGLRSRIEALRADGWSKWEASNPSAWTFLGVDPLGPAGGPREIDLSADWPVYVLSRAAAAQVIGVGASRFTLSPEDGIENMRGILAEFGERAVVIVYQDTPLFVSETCARASLHGCPGPNDCGFESMRLVSGRAQETVVVSRSCRNAAVNARTYSTADRLEELGRAGAVHLRADFAWRDYSPDEILEHWRTVRAGEPVPGAHAANFDRGLEQLLGVVRPTGWPLESPPESRDAP